MIVILHLVFTICAFVRVVNVLCARACVCVRVSECVCVYVCVCDNPSPQ